MGCCKPEPLLGNKIHINKGKRGREHPGYHSSPHKFPPLALPLGLVAQVLEGVLDLPQGVPLEEFGLERSKPLVTRASALRSAQGVGRMER